MVVVVVVVVAAVEEEVQLEIKGTLISALIMASAAAEENVRWRRKINGCNSGICGAVMRQRKRRGRDEKEGQGGCRRRVMG
ncbi:hypothetical protein E2C01_070897 [Portunus trituberculatus]|uniref:Uncharacterized protein n=1 Tax=Portunus trituberculatus TaxID=210409 RepID=A0A5B7I2K4_PORTR|nr:hypothetical protein [Portunus trituberculatus]